MKVAPHYRGNSHPAFFLCILATTSSATLSGRSRAHRQDRVVPSPGVITRFLRNMPQIADWAPFSALMPERGVFTPAFALNSVSTGPGQKTEIPIFSPSARASFHSAWVRRSTYALERKSRGPQKRQRWRLRS